MLDSLNASNDFNKLKNRKRFPLASRVISSLTILLSSPPHKTSPQTKEKKLGKGVSESVLNPRAGLPTNEKGFYHVT